MSDVIVAENLIKHFKRGNEVITALNDVTIKVGKGEMVAITGRSGSGKTTFLSCVGLLESIDSGDLHLAGKDVSKLSEVQRTVMRRELMGFVFQRFFLIPTLTAYENVALPFLFAQKRADHDRINELLEVVGVCGRAFHKPSQMSGGEMQRVAIARSLALDPPIIMADEPTGNLDTTNAQAVFQLFKGLAGKGKSIVIATHSLKLASSCDRVIELSDGRIVKNEKN